MSSLSPSLSGDEVEVEEEEEDEGVDGYRKGGYHAVRPGDQFAAGRYVSQRKLGWGNFSTVWLAFDVQSQRYVALKIQKSAPEFAQAALHEIEFLSEITKRDPSNCKCIIQLIDHFKHTGPNGQHICLVFEFLGDSLLKLVQYNRYKGIGFDRVKRICKSILVGLDYLHSELGIIHSDLKLENVLLISTIDPTKDPIRSGLKPDLERPEGNPNGEVGLNPIEKKLKMRARRVLAKLAEKRKSVVESSRSERSLDGIDLTCKIVDFGNACWADKQFTDFIQTRQYRAPEIILGSGYSFSVDMTEGLSLQDHLALMMELLGKMPKKIATMGTRSKEYFDRHGDLKRIRRLKLSSVERVLVDKYKISESDAREFANFLCPLLDFAPEKRPTAAECLKHPWLQYNEDKTYGPLNNNDAKNIGLAQSTGSTTSGDCTNIDSTCKKGSLTGSCDKTADVKYNTRSTTNNASMNTDVQPNIGSIAHRLAKNADVNLNIGSMTNKDARDSDTKPHIGSIANSDAKSSSVKLDTGNIANRNEKTIDTKPNTGSISSRDDKSSNVDPATSSVVNRDVKRSIRSVVNSYIKNFDAKCNTGSTATSDSRNSDTKPTTRSVASADDARCLDVKPISGSVKSNDAINTNVKSNTGTVANSDAKNTDVQTNTGSVASSNDNSVDTKPNIGRVAASIQRLESSMSKVQSGKYR
ncbi:Serine/threonine-protein kinase SRPK [Dichanthelium oligosanthes]|uniref:non-specific serine/threonine protein kinase n=1 Tax=Dichanthelium oligosanthes TaxID=888268 RepID=A0A1E5WIQ3_9POAL|nr:Serine/threonine-protein kinase SRPK [Dichanthelium oligosanthes]